MITYDGCKTIYLIEKSDIKWYPISSKSIVTRSAIRFK